MQPKRVKLELRYDQWVKLYETLVQECNRIIDIYRDIQITDESLLSDHRAANKSIATFIKNDMNAYDIDGDAIIPRDLLEKWINVFINNDFYALNAPIPINALKYVNTKKVVDEFNII